MNLQQFLDSERVQFSGSTFYTTTQVREWLKDHDTRLINKVLDEVKREVEKRENFAFSDNAIKHVSTIINQLKLK